MGNCAIKPKVLSETGAPAPEELKDSSLLEDQKIDDDAAKSLSNLFLQEKKVKEDEKIMTTEKIVVIGDLKTALAEAKTPAKEVKSPVKETKAPVDDDQKIEKESEEKVIDVMIVKETEEEEEEKQEEVKREA